MTDSERVWWVERDEVIRSKHDGELYHVLARFEDVDRGYRKYEIHDDEHRTQEYWHAEDVRNVFEKTGVVVRNTRKPLQVLDGSLYETNGAKNTDTNIDQE